MPGAAVLRVAVTVPVADDITLAVDITDPLTHDFADRLPFGQHVFVGRGPQGHPERQLESVGVLTGCANRLVIGVLTGCANRLVIGVRFAVALPGLGLGHYDRGVSYRLLRRESERRHQFSRRGPFGRAG